jgi:Tol biopolymer transport system component
VPVEIIHSIDELPSTLSSQKAFFTSTELTLYNSDEVDDNLLLSLDQTYSKILNIRGNRMRFSLDWAYLIYYSLVGDSGDVAVKMFEIETGKTHVLFTSDDVPGGVAYGGIDDPSFSPDGKSVLFQINFTETTFGLGLYSLEEDTVTLLGAEGFNSRPQFSPTGDKILSICEGKKANGFQICIMDSDGSNRKRLTDVEGYHEAWFSPDGQHIVYEHTLTSFFRDPVVGLYAMDLSGENVVNLVDGETHLLTFSSDGKDVVFCKFPEDVYKTETFICEGIYVIGIDGANLRKLAYFDEEFLSKWK